MTDRPVSRKGRRARIHGREPIAQLGLTPDLDEAEAQQQEAHFGVARDQVEHDFVISHVLSALSAHSDQFVFHGGTALSRTFLDGLRLSEDIDLLSVGARREVAETLHRSIVALERDFGLVVADPGLHEVRKDTDACVYAIGDVRVKLATGRQRRLHRLATPDHFGVAALRRQPARRADHLHG